MKKKNHEKNWLKEAAEAMDLQLSSESEEDEEAPRASTRHLGSAKLDPAVARAKAELNALLKQPIMVRGISHRYITSGSRRIVDDILAGNRQSPSCRRAPCLPIGATADSRALPLPRPLPRRARDDARRLQHDGGGRRD